MMKTTLLALAAVAVSGVASARSTFENTAPSLDGLTFKLGVAFPLDNRVKDSLSSSISSIGLEFGVGSNYGSSTESFLAIDYFSGNVGSFGKGSVVPVSYNVRFFRNRGEVARRSYFLAGVGVALTNLDKSETLLMGRAGVGIEVSDHTFFEAVGTLSTSSATSGSFNTIGFYFGYRF